MKAFDTASPSNFPINAEEVAERIVRLAACWRAFRANT
jgi:hypothetical protein